MIKHEDLQYFNPELFAENIFPHQQFMYKSERAYMHYVLPQKRNKENNLEFVRNTPEQSSIEIFRWLEFLGNNPFGNFIKERVEEMWPTVVEEIASFSTFNLQLAGKNPYCNINTNRMFLHYHPPRLSTGKSMTSTYITPLYKSHNAVETFKYTDLNKTERRPKELNEIVSGCKSKLEGAEMLFNEWQSFEGIEADWLEETFPDQGTLCLRFDGARYIHSLENLGDNVYVVLVFNDVLFNDDYDPAEQDDFAVERRSQL